VNKRIRLYVFGITILFSGCGTYKKLACLEPVNVVEFSSEIFNGNYHNVRIQKYSGGGHHVGHKLWYTLCETYSIWGGKVNASDSSIVNLRFVDNRLHVQLSEDGKVLREIVLKAKVKDNYLSIKRKYVLIPILPILWGSHNCKIILANTENGNLLLKAYYSNGAVVIIMASGNSDTVSAEFLKIIDK